MEDGKGEQGFVDKGGEGELTNVALHANGGGPHKQNHCWEGGQEENQREREARGREEEDNNREREASGSKEEDSRNVGGRFLA
eukprot:328812-Hanusia_phi.AAC.1